MFSYNKSYAYPSTTVTTANAPKKYAFTEVFEEKTSTAASEACAGTNCIVDCSCKNANGWYEKTSDTGAHHINATSPRKYAKVGSTTPAAKTCYKKVTCEDYGYKSSLSSGYYGYTFTMGTGGSTLTCYDNNEKPCTYACPNGYYTVAANGYYLNTSSTSKYQILNEDDESNNCDYENKSKAKCYQRLAHTCATRGYTTTSCPTGQTPTYVSVKLGDR